MLNEPSLSNTPIDRRVADSGGLRQRLLKKEDSKVFDPHELSARSAPPMFDSDWEPVVVGDVFTAKSAEEAHRELAVKDQQEAAVLAEKIHAKDMRVLWNVMIAIGGVVLLAGAVVGIIVLARR